MTTQKVLPINGQSVYCVIKITADIVDCGRLFLCLTILTNRIAKTKACQAQADDSDKAFDGEHKHILLFQISADRFLCNRRSQSSAEGLTAYRYSSTYNDIIANIQDRINAMISYYSSIIPPAQKLLFLIAAFKKMRIAVDVSNPKLKQYISLLFQHIIDITL